MRIKISFYFVCFFAFVCSYQSFAGEKKYKVAIVGFYNLENFFDTINDPTINDEEFLPDGANHNTGAVYFDKVRKLATVISQIGTDISPDGLALLGCAEVENESVLRQLIRDSLLIHRRYEIVHYDSPDLRGIDVGLIYNPKYFTPKYSAPLFVPLPDEHDKPHFTRDVLYVYGLLNGDPVHLFVNHWPSRRGGEEASAPFRAMAAAVCKHAIDSITQINPEAKIILMGDLNDDPVSPSVAVVLNAKGELKQVQQGDLYNPWTPLFKNGIGTLAYNDAWNLFDQIIVSSAFLDKNQKGYFFRDAKIFSKPWMLQQSGRYKGYPKRSYNFNKYNGGYSDHFPTYIELLKEVN